MRINSNKKVHKMKRDPFKTLLKTAGILAAIVVVGIGAFYLCSLAVKSDYNTSWRGGRTGLPIGPIANPGSNSIDAALAPSTEKYYYYVYYPAAGKHLFAKTLNEHNANVNKVG